MGLDCLSVHFSTIMSSLTGLVFVVINIATDIMSLWDNSIPKFVIPLELYIQRKKSGVELNPMPCLQAGQ